MCVCVCVCVRACVRVRARARACVCVYIMLCCGVSGETRGAAEDTGGWTQVLPGGRCTNGRHLLTYDNDVCDVSV